MDARRLVLRSLVFHRRTHAPALLTAALVSAVIVAALGVGDSVRSAVTRLADARIGRVGLAAHAEGRLWRADLAGELASALGAPVSASLVLNASLARPDGSARVRGARVLGVDDAFWSLSPGGRAPLARWPEDGVALSEAAAARLGVAVGDPVVIRLESPSAVPRDAPLAAESDATASLLVDVAAVLDAESFGSFSLRIGPVAPANAFLPLARLQQAVGEPGRANALLVAAGSAGGAELGQALAGSVRLADLGLSLRPLDGGRGLELRSRRVFLEEAAAGAALGLYGARGVLAWLVNEIRAGERRTPYSLVAALPPTDGLLPDDLGEREIVVNEWLAADLGLEAGDGIALTYYVLGRDRALEERTTEFVVRAVVPIRGAAADRELMPAFPGIAGTGDCRDWDPGFALDLTRIREKDEAYWDEYGGTPKAFLGLDTGRQLWGNRFGDLTAVRFGPGTDPAGLERALLAGLDPDAFGLGFTDLPAAAAAARAEGMDFGALFLGFSSLVTAAALLLLGLVVALNVAMRRVEIATLLALGFTRGRVRRLFALEHRLVALAGGILGIAFGVGLEAAALAALDTVWSDVAGSLPIAVVVEPGTVALGALGGTLVSWVAVEVVLRRSVGPTVRSAFVRSDELAARIAAGRGGRPVAAWLAATFALAAVAIALLAGTGRDPATAGAFFGSGALALLSALCLAFHALARAGRAREGRRPGLLGLAGRNLGRRRGRSVTTIGVLAFGIFLTLGTAVFRRDRLESGADPASGTGGFALVGESSVAVVGDLNDPEDRRSLSLADDDLAGVRVVGLRVRAGDDASCRSLTRAQAPEIVGVAPEAFAGRFTFVSTAKETGDPWTLLDSETGDGAVPAVIDQATLWTLGKGLGDELELLDEAGRPFRARIDGIIDNAVLHGRLVVSESSFRRLFPSESGYRAFLVETPADRVDAVSAILSRQLENYGIALERTEDRLNAVNGVENTYLGIFQALGGIGLLLGSLGLALVVGRNVLERRSELALLGAVGFSRGRIARLVTLEHGALLGLGLAAGLALLPALAAPGARVATPGTAAVLFGLAAGGLLWTRLAVRIALSGPLLGNLREE